MIPSRREVLLVEDDPDSVLLMREAFKAGRGLVDLKAARDGVEAMSYLRGLGPFAGAARPALVLLDWRLPRKSGEDVLREIRSDPALKLLPVLVLTTSAWEKDVHDAYAAGANCFLTKPSSMADMRALAALIEDFWVLYASLPSAPAPSR